MILHLKLKKKWFDMILSGEKKEEYREIKPFWFRRLYGKRPIMKDTIVSQDFIGMEFINYPIVSFKNGYSKNAPTIIIECNGIKIGKPISGLCEEGWMDKNLFVISLGKIIDLKHLSK